MRDFKTEDKVHDVQLKMPDDVNKKYWVYAWLIEMAPETGNVNSYVSNHDHPEPI